MNAKDWIQHEISCYRCGVKIDPSKSHAVIDDKPYCVNCIHAVVERMVKEGKKKGNEGENKNGE